MAATSLKQPGRRIPDGYVAVPISAGQRAAPVRICVVARISPDPVGGTLVTLRQPADARVYLGALADVGGRVHAWLELWVQDLGSLGRSLAGWREALTNAVLDQRWQRNAEAAAAANAASVVRTGWESRHPPPVWLDVGRGEPVNLADAAGEAWKLCQDEAVLASAGLPTFAGSLHRYLYLPKKGVDGGFVPVTPDAPANEHTRPADLPLGGRTDLVPFNPGGGLLLVREMVGMPLEAYLGLLAGDPDAKPVVHGTTPLHLFGPAASPAGRLGGTGRDAGGWLAGGSPLGRGRAAESLYLRLRALADVAHAVRAQIEKTQTPILSLDPSRFQVRVGEARAGLPALWTATTVLVDPGDTVAATVGGTDATYFLPARPLPASAYRRSPVGQAGEVECDVRAARVVEEPDGTAALEGTISTQERVEAREGDLLRLRIPLGDGRVHAYAVLDRREGATGRDLPFRSLPLRLAAGPAGQLRAAPGATIQRVAVEVLPHFGPAWDLYSVGVIGVRALLVNAANPLPATLAELTHLAVRAAADPAPDDPLGDRVGRARAAGTRFAALLGPDRLAWGPGQLGRPGPAADGVPPALWHDVLAALIVALSADGHGAGPGAAGTADDLRHTFDPFLADLDGLLARAQSLFVPDWDRNREMAGVIETVLAGIAAGG